METDSAHTAVSNAEGALRSATERLARAAHQAVDTLSTYGGQAEQRLRDTTEIASERSREYIAEIQRYVEDRPLVAIGIAAAVGFTVGLLMRSNSSDTRHPTNTHE